MKRLEAYYTGLKPSINNSHPGVIDGEWWEPSIFPFMQYFRGITVSVPRGDGSYYTITLFRELFPNSEDVWKWIDEQKGIWP